jgi:hypothetical protein
VRVAPLLVGLLAAGCASPAAGHQAYGGYPSFLPADTTTAGAAHRVVDASAVSPVLATQGDTVRVHLATPSGPGTALVTVTGPDVPVTGQAHPAPATPATWHLVVHGIAGAVPVVPATFQAVDARGAVHDLRALQAPAPTVTVGGTTAFELFCRDFPTGEGRLRWIPSGHAAPVEWDFVAETD